MEELYGPNQFEQDGQKSKIQSNERERQFRPKVQSKVGQRIFPLPEIIYQTYQPNSFNKPWSDYLVVGKYWVKLEQLQLYQLDYLS